MGTDKGLLVYHGRPQREFLFALLKKYCVGVHTSCREDQGIPEELHPLADRFHMSGPLNGILSAFHHKHTAWLTVAIDMPFVNDGTIELLIAGRDSTRLATCFYNRETKQPEPLLTIWERQAYPFLLKFAHTGNISPRDFLRTHPVKMIDPPDDKVLLNINYPQ